ncbi:putative metal-binding motif-containing protein [Candidatus Uhrbacteria bacterium]|nr:putative metal-binding motif-containing protein [Candidatus Uhrbacteria bacterium]
MEPSPEETTPPDGTSPPVTTSTPDPKQDDDDDGYTVTEGDCDDADDAVHPSAYDDCDGVDNDCDGEIDDDVELSDRWAVYADKDEDGFGDAEDEQFVCDSADGYVDNSEDCDDTLASVNPEADEVCNGQDDDCDGEVDEGSYEPFYQDLDSDGFGDPAKPAGTCAAPDDYVDNADDCDDSDASINPDADEICDEADNDCDGAVDEGVLSTFYPDNDGDGYGNSAKPAIACKPPTDLYVSEGGDCADTDQDVHPGATETCNNQDDDCDGEADEGVNNAYYFDGDNDGYGDPTIPTQGCEQVDGYVDNALDCDDTQASVNPEAAEACNGIDDDCDSEVDQDLETTTFYVDADEDGFGDPDAETTEACRAPEGYVDNAGDCEDADAATYPGAPEQCDGIDNDCDEVVDNDVTTSRWYMDADGDGYGTGEGVEDCLQPAGTVLRSGDCNDGNPAVNPGVTEVCNEADDDCDGAADDGIQKTQYYRDADVDGYGAADGSIQACSQPDGYVGHNADCDDSRSNVHPGAPEECDGLDNDCDTQFDEGVKTNYFEDVDGDGYGDAGKGIQACTQPDGYVANSLDCDDTRSTVHPGAVEVCNGIDDDCDGVADDGLKVIYHEDLDGDGFGNAAVSTQACAQPSGYVLDNSDCDDSDDQTHPGATEVCDNIDNDCNTQIDDGLARSVWYLDSDSDGYGDSGEATEACAQPSGYVSADDDCDDTDAAVHPNAPEQCNGADDDCDGDIDESVLYQTWYEDIDGDGYGNGAVTKADCVQPFGYVTVSGDCDDGNGAIYPGALEQCNSLDDDCDGVADDGVQIAYYPDDDGDRYGKAGSSPAYACSPPSGYTNNNTDCDDTRSSVYPGATETCNGLDDDCDGQADDGVKTAYYTDSDGDGYGQMGSSPTYACAPSGAQVTNDRDCDDADAAVYPGAAEACNGIDDDCDGSSDEGLTFKNYYPDADGDGYGMAGSTPVSACAQPSGKVTNNTDCDDTRSSVNPNAAESCDGLDNDCDGSVDEGVKKTFYLDADVDGYGTSTTTAACNKPSGYATATGDCNDANNTVYPNAIERCGDQADTDCDGAMDAQETVSCPYVYFEGSKVVFRSGSQGVFACKYETSGYISGNWKCDPAATAYTTANAYATGDSPFGPSTQLQSDNLILYSGGLLAVDFAGKAKVTASVFTLVSTLSTTSSTKAVNMTSSNDWRYSYYNQWCEESGDPLCVEVDDYEYEVGISWSGSGQVMTLPQ